MTNLVERLLELSSFCDQVIEMARGDRAIALLKSHGLRPPGAAKEGFDAAIRGNIKSHRAKYNSWMGENLTTQEAAKQVKAYRDHAAKGVKWARKKDLINGIRTTGRNNLDS